jgi:hypothetical protein
MKKSEGFASPRGCVFFRFAAAAIQFRQQSGRGRFTWRKSRTQLQTRRLDAEDVLTSLLLHIYFFECVLENISIFLRCYHLVVIVC